MSSEATAGRKIEWWPILVTGVGIALLLLGVRGFYLRGHFGFIDALYCALLLIPAAVLLLLTAYVLQHAKLVVPMPLLVAGMLVRSYPSFAVALGLALIGAMVGSALNEWKEARRQRRSTPEIGL